MRVLVTRPEPGLSRTLARLAALGHDARGLPLSALKPVPPPSGYCLPDDVVASIATSANAFSGLTSEILSGLVDRPLFAVGARTAEAGRMHGFLDIRQGKGNGRALAARISRERTNGDLPHGNFLYLAGSPRTPDLEDALKAEAMTVSVLPSYQMAGISYSTDIVKRRFLDHQPEMVLFYSANTARQFVDLVITADAEKTLESSRFACLSRAVADALPVKWQARTVAANEPLEEMLLEVAGLMG